MSEVPVLRTQYNQSEMIGALTKAWLKLFNEIPKKESVCVILSQNYAETGGKSFYNNNWANTKYNGKDPNQDWMALTGVWEILNGKKVILPKDHPGSRFLSFKTLDEGVEHHLNQLATGRFKSSWSAVQLGDPNLFAKLLKDARYYTAPLSQYQTNMNFYFKKFMKDQTYELVVSKLPTNHIEPVSISDWNL